MYYHQCPICQERVPETNLAWHLKFQHSCQWTQCFCGVKFESLQELYRHWREVDLKVHYVQTQLLAAAR